MEPHQDHRGQPAEPGPPPPPSSQTTARLSVRERLARWNSKRINWRVLAVLAAAALILALWIDARSQIRALQQDLVRKLAEVDNYDRESRQAATQARDTVRDLEYRLGAIESQVAEAQSQRLAVESLYLELTRNRDERILAEVEQILLIASQQLQLAGNLKAALIALEAADSRLQRADSAQFVALRRAVRRDIERLRSMPYVDVAGMSLRLEAVDQEVDNFPLAMHERPAEEEPVAAQPDEGALTRLAREVWRDVRSLVRIQRVETEAVPLVSPSQAFFLRENLRLRLMSARVALLAHEGDSFKRDTRDAVDWLQRYFAASDREVGQALTTLRQLAAAEVAVEVPDISGSLEAVRNAKVVRERRLR
ncbi:MAG TPA: uroporphyrinogen-III C-methyltransferase [Burkholderiales bacterium]|nr:uroporphyrinogen-III C-methyltransferase [Burkholderiales bacterium]